MSFLEQFKMVKYDYFNDFKLLFCEYFLSSFKESNNFNNELSTLIEEYKDYEKNYFQRKNQYKNAVMDRKIETVRYH
jgi:hypothetical protein